MRKNEWSGWEKLVFAAKIIGIGIAVFLIGGLISLGMFPL